MPTYPQLLIILLVRHGLPVRLVAQASPGLDLNSKLASVTIDMSDRLVYLITPEGEIVDSNARGPRIPPCPPNPTHDHEGTDTLTLLKPSPIERPRIPC